MKAYTRLILAAATFALAAPATAQTLNSSYFMEGSVYRHQLNPAFENQQNYVSIPIIGNFNSAVRGNFGLGDVLFSHPTSNKTVTYLHPSVSVDDALKGLNSKNRIQSDINIQLVSVGFKGLGGFNTITIGTRIFAGLSLPYDLFEMTKNLQNKNYSLSKASIYEQSYAELALGHSHKINDNWRVGGKLKFLFGAARLNAELTDVNLNLQSNNTWTATANAKVEANMKGLNVTTKSETYNDAARGSYTTIDDFDVKSPGLGGFGMAVDLGAEYDFQELVPGLKASLAFTDIGFIKWNNNIVIENAGKPFTFNGFTNVKVMDGDGTKLSDQTDKLADDLADLYHLEYKGDTGGKTSGLGTTMNIGVEYALPMYDKVRFGLLSSTRFQGAYTWNEERLSVNYAPCKWFDMNINGAIGTFGPAFGWMLNLHPKGFNLFLGMDKTLGKVSKQWVPLSSNVQFSMGINIVW